MNSGRNNKLKLPISHCIRLIFANCCFKGQQMLILNPVSLVKNLTPAILTRALHTKH